MKSYSDRLQFCWAGQNTLERQIKCGPFIRTTYILHYVASGKGYYEFNGKKYTVKAGQTFLIYPNTLVYYYPDTNTPWKYYWVDFSGDEADELLCQTGFSPETPVSPVFRDEIDRHFSELAYLFEQGHTSEYKMLGYLYFILGYFIKHFPVKEKNDGFSEMLNYIKQNYHRHDFSTEELSEYFNMDRTTIYRRFKSKLNISPNNYILQTRINAAKELLQNETKFTVIDISRSVGFSNSLYFSAYFKKCVGLSPSEFRNKHRK